MATTKVTIEKTCMMCQQTKTILIPEEGLQQWRNGTLIQDALPNVSLDDRELLISGVCGICFDEMFAEDEDEYEYDIDEGEESEFEYDEKGVEESDVVD